MCPSCEAGIRPSSGGSRAGVREARRARRLRRRFGSDGRLIAPFPRKPPRMRWARYDALREEALAAERAWAEAQQHDTARMLERRGIAHLSPTLSAFVRRHLPPH